MRHRLATTRFAIVATLAMGHWSTVSAASSFQVVNPPSDAPQAHADAQNSGSSIQVGTVPAGNVVTAPGGSSFRVVTAPKVENARKDAQQAQAAPMVPQVDERLPGEPLQREEVLLLPKTGRQISFTRPFTNILISNPDAVDALPIDDQNVFLKAKGTGDSDIFFYNKGELIRSLSIIVDDAVVRRRAVPDREAQAPPLWRMEIHNKALLTSATNFRCGVDGCHYVNELTVSEPAPLPRGYSNQTVNSTSPEGQGVPVTVPAEPTH